MRVLVIGGAGQLGADLVLALAGHEVLAPGHGALDLREAEAVDLAVAAARPDWIAVVAALHDVERCEREPAEALAVNALGAWNAGRAAQRHGARLLYVSTDYVFPGEKGSAYLESDLPAPVNAYGASKLAGEAMARAALPGALVVRTAGLFGLHPCRGKGGLNFVERMLALGRERGQVRVVTDEGTSPTWCGHLAPALGQAMQRGASGLLHLAAGGSCSWHEFARAIFEEAGMQVGVEAAGAGEFPRKAPRPAFSALASQRWGELGLEPLPHWREGLRAYLAERERRP